MLIDILIILFILVGGFIGAKRGFTKEIVTVVGLILVFVLSFLLKDLLADFMLKYLPFFKFNGLTSLNILLYETLSLVILIGIFSSILNALINLTSIFEKLLDITIILGFASKIAGFVLGCLEYVAISFILLSLFSVKLNTKDSKVSDFILNHTPLLSNVCSDTIATVNDIADLKERYEGQENKEAELNYEMLNLMIKNKLISEKKVTELINDNKLKM